jgi:hypothetical protein
MINMHIDDKFILKIIFGIALQFIIQFGTAVWWAATMTEKIDNLSFQMAATNTALYTKSDAEKDKILFDSKITELGRRINLCEKYIQGQNNGR